MTRESKALHWQGCSFTSPFRGSTRFHISTRPLFVKSIPRNNTAHSRNSFTYDFSTRSSIDLTTFPPFCVSNCVSFHSIKPLPSQFFTTLQAVFYYLSSRFPPLSPLISWYLPRSSGFIPTEIFRILDIYNLPSRCSASARCWKAEHQDGT
jgi:hypothetical protein